MTTSVITGVVDGVTQTLPTISADPWRPRRAPDPESPPPFPIQAPKSEAGKEAQELHTEWVKRTEYIKAIRANIEKRKAEVGQLETEYHAELQRAAAEREVSDRDQQLLATIRAFGPELSDVWEPRLKAALDLASDAAGAYFGYLDSHFTDLLAELEPDAKRIVGQYRAEREKAAKVLGKLEGERNDIAAAARQIIVGVRPFTHDDISTDPSELPLPSEDAWQRYREIH